MIGQTTAANSSPIHPLAVSSEQFDFKKSEKPNFQDALCPKYLVNSMAMFKVAVKALEADSTLKTLEGISLPLIYAATKLNQ